MSPATLELEPELIPSFDGTMIAVRHTGPGEGDGHGLPLLAANAVGATYASLRRALVDLERQRPVITWDLRGLLDSGPPVSPRNDPGAHAEDAIAALEHHGVDRFVLVSWSNGSRIAIEIATRYPERVAALAMISGGYGHPPGRLLRFELASMIPVIASVAKYFSGPLGTSFRGLIARPELAGLVRQSGMVGATADTPALVDLLKGMASCDLKSLLTTLQDVVGDSGAELLGHIQAPTLMVIGDHDQFTSKRMTVEMKKAISDSRTITYEGATHYLPLEFPARLSDDLRRFLADVGV